MRYDPDSASASSELTDHQQGSQRPPAKQRCLLRTVSESNNHKKIAGDNNSPLSNNFQQSTNSNSLIQAKSDDLQDLGFNSSSFLRTRLQRIQSIPVVIDRSSILASSIDRELPFVRSMPSVMMNWCSRVAAMAMISCQHEKTQVPTNP